MSWTQLSPQDSASFLKAVTGNGDPVFFDPTLCEVHKHPADYYLGYDLIRIVNNHSIPALVFDYFSNGEQHYYIDGSERAFHNVSSQGALNLNIDNVGDYIRAFISYVYERGNSLIFLHRKAKNLSPTYDEAHQTYNIALPLMYQNQEVEGRVEITAEGHIHVRKPIEVSFLTELHPDTANPYRHPLEEQILEQSKALLSMTKVGVAMLAENPEADLRVLASPHYQAFHTNAGTGYIAMPTAEQNAKYMQAICMAACLQGLKQVKNQYYQAHPIDDKDLYLQVNYGNNLDIFLETCKIVSEYEAQNIPESRMALENMGLGLAYEAYKDGVREYDMEKYYFKSLEQAGLMEKPKG